MKFALDLLSGEENLGNQDEAGDGSSIENPKPNKSKKKPSPGKGDSFEDPSDQKPGKGESLEKKKGSLEEARGSLEKKKGSLEEKTPEKKNSELGSLESLDNGPQKVS